ncbi:PQQ-like beta-propeller repeat protein [Candidatus Woesearchaeota archaeon]|nr:PQQ-like beta-propeller repeat protein [Candidatus Woesearchaeota archaeon]
MFSFNKSTHHHKGRILEKWVFDAKSPLLSSAAAVDIDKDGKKEIIFGTRNGSVICIDEQSKKKWQYDIKEQVEETESFFYDSDRIDSVPATPTIKDVNGDKLPEILFGTELGIVYCLNNQGKLLWKYKTQGAVRSRILVEDIDKDGTAEILFGTTAGKFVILDGNGKERSVIEVDGSIESEPAVSTAEATQLIFGTESGTLYSYSPLGNKLWEFKARGPIRAKPAFGKLLSEQDLVIGDTTGMFYCLDLKGNEHWHFITEGAIYGQASMADLNNDDELEVVFGSCDNKVYCLSHRGEKLWSYETDFWIVTAPLITDIDNDGALEVVVGSYDHNLYVLDGEGAYNLDYMPGLSGVAHQAGHYTSVMTSEPGAQVGKRLWQIKTQGMIVGCEELEKDNIIVNVKSGFVDDITHSN